MTFTLGDKTHPEPSTKQYYTTGEHTTSNANAGSQHTTGAGPTTANLAGQVPQEPRGNASQVDSSAFGSNSANTHHHKVPGSGGPAHPTRASQIPGELEGPVHKSKILNDLDPRVKEHPGSATTGGHHTIPKVGETHHEHNWKD